jgi:hypothetical protein
MAAGGVARNASRSLAVQRRIVRFAFLEDELVRHVEQVCRRADASPLMSDLLRSLVDAAGDEASGGLDVWWPRIRRVLLLTDPTLRAPSEWGALGSSRFWSLDASAVVQLLRKRLAGDAELARFVVRGRAFCTPMHRLLAKAGAQFAGLLQEAATELKAAAQEGERSGEAALDLAQSAWLQGDSDSAAELCRAARRLLDAASPFHSTRQGDAAARRLAALAFACGAGSPHRAEAAWTASLLAACRLDEDAPCAALCTEALVIDAGRALRWAAGALRSGCVARRGRLWLRALTALALLCLGDSLLASCALCAATASHPDQWRVVCELVRHAAPKCAWLVASPSMRALESAACFAAYRAGAPVDETRAALFRAAGMRTPAQSSPPPPLPLPPPPEAAALAHRAADSLASLLASLRPLAATEQWDAVRRACDACGAFAAGDAEHVRGSVACLASGDCAGALGRALPLPRRLWPWRLLGLPPHSSRLRRLATEWWGTLRVGVPLPAPDEKAEEEPKRQGGVAAANALDGGAMARFADVLDVLCADTLRPRSQTRWLLECAVCAHAACDEPELALRAVARLTDAEVWGADALTIAAACRSLLACGHAMDALTWAQFGREGESLADSAIGRQCLQGAQAAPAQVTSVALRNLWDVRALEHLHELLALLPHADAQRLHAIREAARQAKPERARETGARFLSRFRTRALAM